MKEFKASEVIADLNNCKKALEVAGNTFTKQQIINVFKNCSIPTNDIFWKTFRESGLIEKVSKKGWKFTLENPIVADALQTIYNKYLKISKNYFEEYKNSKKLPMEEEQAIQLLKSLGYKIYKPTTTFEEV